MKLEEVLMKRSSNKCELCKSENSLSIYRIPPQEHSYEENSLMVCSKCLAQIEKKRRTGKRLLELFNGSNVE